MIKEGKFLYFKPPLLSGNSISDKKRYMLVVENSAKDKTVKMINVSSLKGKEHNLLYESNIEINNYSPLPVPSFAKVGTLYIIDYFKELEKYVAFNGKVLGEIQFKYIDKYRLEYMKKREIETIQYTEEEFKENNK